MSLCQNWNFQIPISLNPDGVDFRYFKFRWFELIEFIVANPQFLSEVFCFFNTLQQYCLLLKFKITVFTKMFKKFQN